MRSWSICSAAAVALATAWVTTSIHVPQSGSQIAHAADEGQASSDRRTQLAARIDSIIAERTSQLPGSRVGVAVLDIASGAILYEHDGSGLYNTASNTKLVTASAALALLGPAFRYYTAIYGNDFDAKGVVKGDLYIRGRGDPALGTAELYAMARDLRQLGVRKVTGKIVVDSGYFDAANLPPHFDEDPLDQAAYRAPIGASSLNFNGVAIEIRPSLTGSGPALVRPEPPNSYVKIDGVVDTVSRGRSRLRMESKVEKDHMVVTVRGQVRADDGLKSYRRRIAHPDLYLGSALRHALLTYGISVAKKDIGTGEVPTDARALVWRVSEPMSVLVRGLGKYSNNYVAEMLLKTIGAEHRSDAAQPATWNDGLTTVRRWLEETVGFTPEGYYYGNGSGLFASNRFSPRQLVSLLALVYRDFRLGPDLLASLSIAGVDGTIRSRMAGGSAEQRIRAKTGTLDGVSSLSGYAALDGMSPLAFSIVVNGYGDRSGGIARLLQDEVCESLVDFLRQAM